MVSNSKWLINLRCGMKTLFLGLLWLSLVNIVFNHLAQTSSPLNPTVHAVDTEGCQIPLFDPFDTSLNGLYKQVTGRYECPGRPPITIVNHKDNTLHVDKEELKRRFGNKTVSCLYQSFGFKEGSDSKWIKARPVNLPLDVPVKVSSEFITVTCKSTAKKATKYKFHHYFTQQNRSLIRKKKSLLEQWKKEESPKETLNIVVVVTDSTSRLNFVRQCPKTREYLLKNLGGFEMLGYTKVGLNTYPNMLAFMSGLTRHDAVRRGLKKQMTMDDPSIQPPIPFLWDKLRERGYTTMACQDWPEASEFRSHGRRGFLRRPYDFYWRPFALRVQTDSEMCIGNQPYLDTQLNYTKEFIRKYKTMPYFTFTFNSKKTHDCPDCLGKHDTAYYDFVKTLKEEGHLNNTMLIFMGDHGSRYGNLRKTHIGQMEDYMPLMVFTLPKWFLHRYPGIHSALRINTKRLSTHFDMYTTFINLLTFNGTIAPEVKVDRSHNIFGELSNKRTCHNLNIPEQFCPCKLYQSLSSEDETVKKATTFVLNHLNTQQLLANLSNKCAPLRLHTVIDARKLNFSKGREIPGSVNYQIIFSVLPSSVTMDVTVTHNSVSGALKMVGAVIPLDRYEYHSACIEDDVALKRYCYCTNLLTTQGPNQTSNHTSQKAL